MVSAGTGGWCKVKSCQATLRVAGSMELESVVPALVVFAKGSYASRNFVAVGSDEPVDGKHGGVNETDVTLTNYVYRVIYNAMISLSAEQRAWLDQKPTDVMSLYGGMAPDVFAAARQEHVLPVIIPTYNEGSVEDSQLPVTLASLAVASSATDRLIRPIVAINGPEDGSVAEICNAFGLQKDLHVIQFLFKGKLRTIQAAARRLLGEEGYKGPFATTDDDAIIPKSLPGVIMNHMAGQDRGAVGGGSVRYYQTPGVSPVILVLRNAGLALKENRAAHAKMLLAHGNNQWFASGPDELVLDAITSLKPTIGYGDDAAIVEAIRVAKGTVYPITLDRAARVAVAGDRSKTVLDLVHTALGKGGMRYQADAAWSGTAPLR